MEYYHQDYIITLLHHPTLLGFIDFDCSRDRLELENSLKLHCLLDYTCSCGSGPSLAQLAFSHPFSHEAEYGKVQELLRTWNELPPPSMNLTRNFSFIARLARA